MVRRGGQLRYWKPQTVGRLEKVVLRHSTSRSIKCSHLIVLNIRRFCVTAGLMVTLPNASPAKDFLEGCATVISPPTADGARLQRVPDC